jgi:hypothetical protein
VNQDRTSEACRVGELVSSFVARLTPVPGRYDSVAEALGELLPGNLQAHCRIAGFQNGSLRLAADGSSYMFELQLCKAVLLRELQRLCPGARIRRIEVGMLRQ